MLWIRDFPVDHKKLGERIVIHGHSPKSLAIIYSQEGKSVINIDGGCVYKYNEELGNLIAFELREWKLISARNCEEQHN